MPAGFCFSITIKFEEAMNAPVRFDPAFDLAIEAARHMPIEAGLLGHRLKRVSAAEMSGPCPHWSDSKDTLGVNIRKRAWLCHRCGAKGTDAISLAMHVGGLDFIGAVEMLTGVRRSPNGSRAGSGSGHRPVARSEGYSDPAGSPASGARQAAADEAERDRRKLAIACRIISELVPLRGTFGESYLSEIRGIDVDAIADVLERTIAIGWHPEVLFREEGHPLDGRCLWCIVGVMTDPVTARLTGAISRTYLNPTDGTKVGKAKTLGTPAGIVRLTPDEDVSSGLHVAEGLETALAGMAIGFRPMWSTGTTSLMRSLPVLGGIEALTIFADHDENGAGLKAAQDAARRWVAAGREAHIRMLRQLGDLNDAVREHKS
jgi:hypothetical protein